MCVPPGSLQSRISILCREEYRTLDPLVEPMSAPSGPSPAEQLLENARLWNLLEPYEDDSLWFIRWMKPPVQVENAYLRDMLAWEQAPVLPVAQWFEPPLEIPPPGQLDDQELPKVLEEVIDKLFQKRIVLHFTEHLSDRELYEVIYRGILPAREKRLELPDVYYHWDCADLASHPQVWLRYYATERQRRRWSQEHHLPLPPREDPPFPRRLPRVEL